MTALTTHQDIPYPLGTDPLGETDLRIKALADYFEAGMSARAKVYATAVTTLTTSVPGLVQFGGEEMDPTGMHSTVTNPSRLTIAKAGRYDVRACCSFVSNAAGYRQINLMKNGVRYATFLYPPPNTTAWLGAFGSVLCVAGDYLEVQCVQTSGGNLNVSAGQADTWFEAAWVGEL